jgi:subtilisin family serine protease
MTRPVLSARAPRCRRVSPRAATRGALLAALAAACLAFVGQGAQAFPNTAADASQQWYLQQDHAWSGWSALPTLAPVKVAVLDSGIDAGDPAFTGKIAAGKSFVGGSWKVDTDGHGTFIAGIVAANPADGATAGMAFNAKLLVAKIVDGYGVIPTAAEVAAIHWAVNEGARVINLSWGAQRDPADPQLDGYLRAERTAIEWAYSKGVMVVAAAGNGTNAPTEPWPYANYPAWLPNVLSVAALAQDGSVPAFSNRDLRRIDLAAPGAGIFSTIPRNLEETADNPSCAGVPYSNCGPPEFMSGNGTSFAAPQVAAAAALLLGVDPKLSPDQVMWLLERSATPMAPVQGCAGCTAGHEAATGFGRLDVAAAVALLRSHPALPPPDVLEPDDDTGNEAHPVSVPATITSSLSYWDDPADVFALRLHAGQKLEASVSSPANTTISLRLWRPGAPDLMSAGASWLATSSSPAGADQRITYRVRASGVYDLELVDQTPSPDRAVYHLSLAAARIAGPPA